MQNKNSNMQGSILNFISFGIKCFLNNNVDITKAVVNIKLKEELK